MCFLVGERFIEWSVRLSVDDIIDGANGSQAKLFTAPDLACFVGRDRAIESVERKFAYVRNERRRHRNREVDNGQRSCASVDLQSMAAYGLQVCFKTLISNFLS